MMKTITLLALLFSQSLWATGPFGYKKQCPETPLINPAKPLSEYTAELRANNIRILPETTVDGRNVERFLTEYKKFPQDLRTEMVRGRARITLMEGDGVTVDPSFTSKTTTDGRSWEFVPGSGGEVSGSRIIPTRVVINHLYDHHGATNLVLHEHAHTLDSLYGTGSLSKTKAWKDLVDNTPGSRDFLLMLCSGVYCADSKVESFAELFAYYHGCEETKKHMEESVPEIAEFFRTFNSARNLLDGTTQVASTTPGPSQEVACEMPMEAALTEQIKPLTDIPKKLLQKK